MEEERKSSYVAALREVGVVAVNANKSIKEESKRIKKQFLKSHYITTKMKQVN